MTLVAGWLAPDAGGGVVMAGLCLTPVAASVDHREPSLVVQVAERGWGCE